MLSKAFIMRTGDDLEQLPYPAAQPCIMPTAEETSRLDQVGRGGGGIPACSESGLLRDWSQEVRSKVSHFLLWMQCPSVQV